ncbi:MAG TPA: orotate phosphoribosyltransferase [Flavobacteriales bacterium]|nr:orotate phosphoribosyltransferase [Flavobacteriales bacterium]HRE74527.1 orotate phosphoribosyltransferase [Flavobacteriales bacterium]HRJ36973.1 orotate phosphoribosyltransferase [Flavobacteriales bacterium]HRJ37861.1 orotate phosphoribosyltransferase [Flavobacteriales bacterium]
MSVNKDSALKVAEFLLQVKAVKLQPNKPFTWASGLRSPIYCDNRVTLSYPHIRTFIRQELSKVIAQEFAKGDIIVGVATGGIAQGVLVAEELGLPFAYVRPEPKSHGMGNQVEGVIEPGQSVIVVEDLVSTGKSSLNAVDAITAAGGVVKGMVAIFTYGFEDAAKKFKDKNVNLATLTNYDILIEQAVASNYVSEKDLGSLREWRVDPKSWSEKQA